MENRKINREAFKSRLSKMNQLKEAREYELDVIKQCTRSPSNDIMHSPINTSKPVVNLNKYKIKRKSSDNTRSERISQHDFNPKMLGSPGSQVNIKIKYDRHLKVKTFKTFDRVLPFKSHSKNSTIKILPQNSALYLQRRNLFSTQVQNRKSLRDQEADENKFLCVERFDPIQDIYHRKKSFYTSTYDRRVCDERLNEFYKSYHH